MKLPQNVRVNAHRPPMTLCKFLIHKILVKKRVHHTILVLHPMVVQLHCPPKIPNASANVIPTLAQVPKPNMYGSPTQIKN
jgi:hypothetical protein